MAKSGGKSNKETTQTRGKSYSIRAKGTKPPTIANDDDDSEALEPEPMKSKYHLSE
jgi:hypothetical protein